jgi:endoglucanase
MPSSLNAILFRLIACTALYAGLASATSEAGQAAMTPQRSGSTSANDERTGTSDNPLANRPWAAYEGPGDPVWVAYTEATGDTQPLLGKIALQPRTRWYGDWIATSQIRSAVARQIATAQAGDPETLVPLADFRLKPWEKDACTSLPTAVEQSDYKTWTQEFAAGIGDAQVSVVLQPDGPFALCAPHGSHVPSHLIKYAAKTLAALPNTSVYIDAGASDWLDSDPARALKLLIPAGVADVRGFALNSTHYASTADQIAFGAAVVKALAKRGISDKHFVVNTAANGQPFDGGTYKGRDFDNARTCKSKAQHHCVTLGIPPTADVANPAWGLSAKNAKQALKYCDGYQWTGRPWLFDQADPFVLKRALDVARTTPY